MFIVCCLMFMLLFIAYWGSEYDYGGSHNGLGLLVPRLPLVKNDLCERACLCRTNSIKSTHTLPLKHKQIIQLNLFKRI